MEITRQADYAVRAVLEIARLPQGQRAPTSEIAERQRIPPTFLAKIVAQLAVAGVVNTTRGAHGGVMLARSPEAITLLDVVEAIDGPLTLNECVDDHSACPLGETCPVRDVWCEAQAELARKLHTTTFAALVQRQNSGAAAVR